MSYFKKMTECFFLSEMKIKCSFSPFEFCGLAVCDKRILAINDSRLFEFLLIQSVAVNYDFILTWNLGIISNLVCLCMENRLWMGFSMRATCGAFITVYNKFHNIIKGRTSKLQWKINRWRSSAWTWRWIEILWFVISDKTKSKRATVNCTQHKNVFNIVNVANRHVGSFVWLLTLFLSSQQFPVATY